MDLFRERLHNILKQLTSDQRGELMEKLFEKPQFQPKGYPFNYNSKSFEELSDEEVKFLHGSFIDIQFSDDPTLQGEDIRGVIIYPSKP